jgi:hypothetical protein
MTETVKNRIMIFGPKTDGTVTAAGADPSVRSFIAGQPRIREQLGHRADAQ